MYYRWSKKLSDNNANISFQMRKNSQYLNGKNVISKYGIPDYIIMDQDSVLMSSLMNYIQLDIKIKTMAFYNHQLLQTEHDIKSLSIILTQHLTDIGQMWPKYLPLATSALLCNPNFV